MTRSHMYRRGARLAIVSAALGIAAAAAPALAGDGLVPPAVGPVQTLSMPPAGAWQIPPPPGKEWLTVAAVSMNAKADTAANLQVIFSRMEQAAGSGVRLIVFPELALQGCPGWRDTHAKPPPADLAYSQQTAETIPGPSTDLLVEKAKELDLFVVFGMMEKDSAGRLFNTSVFLGPDGVIGKHRKTVAVGNDDLIFNSGSGFRVFSSPIGKVGLMICAEMVLEPGADLARMGADLLVSTSAWWAHAGAGFGGYVAGNASQARRWHVASNLVGVVGYATNGNSMVSDPLGRILCDTGRQEGMVMWTTDLMTEARQSER